MFPSFVNTCDLDFSSLPGNRSASTLAHCLEMKHCRLRYLAELNGCKVNRMRMTKSSLLEYIEHKLDDGGRVIVPDNSARCSWLDGAWKKRPKSKAVVKRMHEEGKSILQIRAALRLLGFTDCIICERTKDLDPKLRAHSQQSSKRKVPAFVRDRLASAVSSVSSVAELREMTLAKLRHVAVLNGVAIRVVMSDGRKGRSRSKFEMLDDLEHKLQEGMLVYHMPRVCKRPASALVSLSTLAEFLDMNITKLRHVAAMNGVRISVGKSDGCKPRKRRKAEIIQDIQHKLANGDPLLVNSSYSVGTASERTRTKRRRPFAKDVVVKMETEGRNRSQIRAILRAHGFTQSTIQAQTKHMVAVTAGSVTSSASAIINASETLGSGTPIVPAAKTSTNNSLDCGASHESN